MKANKIHTKSLKEYEPAPYYIVKPFMSDSLINYINSEGNAKCLIRYLEYLTLKCNVTSKDLHTELGCLYIRCIISLVKKSERSLEAIKESD